MTKQAIISFDLTAMAGTARLKMPSFSLPRHNKTELELTIADCLLQAVRSRSSDSFTNVRANADDPPDIFLEHNGVTVGMELTELLPPNRFEKDAIIRSLREKILSDLAIGPKTRNRVVNISFKDDYSERFRPKNLVGPMVNLLDGFFDAYSEGEFMLQVPPEFDGTVSQIFVRNEDLSADPRISDADHPLIIFGAQHTILVPDSDIPVMLDASLGPKLLHDLRIPTWLVLWSHHPAIGAIQDDIVSQLRPCLSLKPIRYQRVFYLGLALPGIMAHFATAKESRPIFDKSGP